MDVEETDLDPSALFLLWAARETGALDALLDDADTAAEVAAAAGITDRAADLVVSSLVELGFLARVSGGLEPTDRMLGFLAAADLRSVGRVPDALDAVAALARLPETMRTGDPPAGDLHRRLGARAATDEATVRAVTTAAVRQAPDAERVLDVRGAPGPYAEAFAGLGLDVTLVDRPDAVERSAPLLAPTDVETVAVGPDDPLPGPVDLAFAGDVSRRLDPAGNRRLCSRLADALAPGGAAVLADVVWGRSDRTVPAATTALARDGGGVYGEDDYADWFAVAGLGEPEVFDVPGTDRQVVVGRKPDG